MKSCARVRTYEKLRTAPNLRTVGKQHYVVMRNGLVFSSNVTGISLLGTARSRKFGPRIFLISVSVSGIYFVNELKHENSPPQAEFF